MATNEAPNPDERDFPRSNPPAQNAQGNASASANPRVNTGANDGGNADSSGGLNNSATADVELGGVIVAFPGAVPPKLSEVLERLITEFEHRPVTLREVIIVLQGRAYNLLMLLLSLPFLLPIPLPV